MIVTHIFMSILSRRHPDTSSACSRPNASTCLVVGRPMVYQGRQGGIRESLRIREDDRQRGSYNRDKSLSDQRHVASL